MMRSSCRASSGKRRAYPALSITTASGSRRRSHDPSSILRGAPVSVASSRPRQNETANFPSSVRATGLPLKSLTAHPTPSTPRTRMRSVSLSALVCSKYSVLASITQISASVTSAIWLPVRLRIPAKMDVWFSNRNVQKAMVKISPRYLARSPVSILSATKFMLGSPSNLLLFLSELDDVHHLITAKKLGSRLRTEGLDIELPGRPQNTLTHLFVRHSPGHDKRAAYSGKQRQAIALTFFFCRSR